MVAVGWFNHDYPLGSRGFFPSPSTVKVNCSTCSTYVILIDGGFHDYEPGTLERKARRSPGSSCSGPSPTRLRAVCSPSSSSSTEFGPTIKTTSDARPKPLRPDPSPQTEARATTTTMEEEEERGWRFRSSAWKMTASTIAPPLADLTSQFREYLLCCWNA